MHASLILTGFSPPEPCVVIYKQNPEHSLPFRLEDALC